jgi:hypothetical protein
MVARKRATKQVAPPRGRKPTTKRRRTKFATMKCPIKGCTHWLSETPGTVPGVKRHVIALHGRTAYRKVQWPAIYTDRSGSTIAKAIRKRSTTKQVKTDDLAKLTIKELRDRAKAKGIPVSGKRKDELVSALS